MKNIRRVGKEIKAVATFAGFILYIPFAVLGVLVYFIAQESDYAELSAAGIVIGVLGIIVAWLLTSLIYGYGELIDQTMETHYAIKDLQTVLIKKLNETNESVSSEVKILTEINKNVSKGT